ncbi:MAG: hypothetical protein AB2661_11820, partial [Candidatus Thiodiazotropha sp.]
MEEFDPLPHQKAVRTVQDYQQEILEVFEEEQRHELVFYRTPWVIGSFLRGWQMDISEGHPSGVDVRAFMQEVEPRIHDKLEEEILALNGIKFQLALRVQLRKDNPDGSEEYTDPVLRHKQEALLQALNKAILHLVELLEKWTQRGSGWVVDRVQTLWLDIARYQPLRGGSYIPLPAAVRSKKAVINMKNKDDDCLRCALRAALAYPPPPHNPERPTWYPNIHRHHITQRDQVELSRDR